MDVQLQLAVERDDDATSPRVTWDELSETLEAEIESLTFEVNGVVFNIRVTGKGRNARELAASAALRKGH